MERSGWKLLSIKFFKQSAFLLPLLLGFCASAAGQLVTLDGGQNMAGQPSGGVVGVDFGKWAVEGSMGELNGSLVGGADMKAKFNRQWGMKVGDQSIELGIPSDTQFNAEVMASGASVSYTRSPYTRIEVFGGMAGAGYALTNVLYFVPQIPLGTISIDHYLDTKKRVLLFARALFSNQQTILGGASYQTKKLQAGVTLGVGSNQPHTEGILNYKNQQWDIRAGYIYSGNKFQLLTLPQFRIAQQDRENLDLRWSPWKETSLILARHQYLEPTASATGGTRAYTRGSTDMAGGMLSLHGLGLGANVYESQFQGKSGSAASLFASQTLTNLVHLSADYYRPLHSTDSMPMLVLSVDEKLNRRLTLAQFASYVNDQWTINYGGGLRFDWFEANLGYATNFIPLAAGGGRFEEAMDLSGHVNLGRWQLSMHTYIQPNGAKLYEYEVKTFFFHPTAGGIIQAPDPHASTDFPSFLIAGRVTLEETGKPLADIPIRIGDEIVYSDEAGNFSLRVTHKHVYNVQPMLDHQIGAYYYEQVSGSSTVMAGTDDVPGQVQLVVLVNQKKTPSLLKGGIVIGTAVANPDGTIGNTQSGARQDCVPDQR